MIKNIDDDVDDNEDDDNDDDYPPPQKSLCGSLGKKIKIHQRNPTVERVRVARVARRLDDDNCNFLKQYKKLLIHKIGTNTNMI